MVMIRLSRIGKKNHPTYRVVVSDKQKDTKAPYLEALGNYDPHRSPSHFEVNKERLSYWLSVGAQMSDTVHNLCVTHKLIDAPKRDMMHKKVQQESDAAPTADGAKAEAAAQPQQSTTENKPEEAPKEEKK